MNSIYYITYYNFDKGYEPKGFIKYFYKVKTNAVYPFNTGNYIHSQYMHIIKEWKEMDNSRLNRYNYSLLELIGD